jgi:hypothetical protein
MKKMLLILAALLVYYSCNACTSAIISGKHTDDGRPLMWKHRDTSNENNKLRYFTESEYDYIGLVNAGGRETGVWIGMNETGLSIMNTATYNLFDSDDNEKERSAGSFMALALSHCGSLKDFERILDTISMPTGLSSNFGVIDGFGGAAYYEVGDTSWIKIDVNDPLQAPMGFIIRTNYSFSGDQVKGKGYARYITAYDLFYRNTIINNLNVNTILREADRSLYNSFTRDDLKNKATGKDEIRLVHFNDNIARKNSTSCAVIRGIRAGDQASSSTMWVVLGWPLASVAYPVWLNPDHILPEVLTASLGAHAPVCDISLELKKRCFPAEYGSGPDYLDINRIFNNNGTGYLQWMLPLEERILNLAANKMIEWDGRMPSTRETVQLYKEIDRLIINEYRVHEPEVTIKYIK